MTGNLRILATNLHDTATLAATSEAMPIANTQVSPRPYVWRSTDLQEQQIDVTLSGVDYIDCIALAQHNLGALGEVQVEFFQGAFTEQGLVKDSGAMPTEMLVPLSAWRVGIDPWGATYNDRLPGGSSLVIYWLDQPIAADRYRITLTSSDTSAGYFEVGRIFAGLSSSPETNMSWNPDVRWIESIEHVRTEGGSSRSVGGGEPRRAVSISLDWLSEADRQRLLTDLVSVSKAADLLVSLYPEQGGLRELEHTMVCRRTNDFGHTYSHYNNWQTTLDFEEV